MIKTILDFLTEGFKLFSNLFITPKKQIQKVVRIYDMMNKILDETEVQRFLVFKVHNGGGLIKPSTDLFVSVLYEDYKLPFKSVKEEYQRLPVDKEYIKMLLDVMNEKKVFYGVRALSDGLLKNIYLNEGVKNSIIYFLGQDKRNMYFCSVGTSWDDENLKLPQQSVPIDLAVNIIKQNIK